MISGFDTQSLKTSSLTTFLCIFFFFFYRKTGENIAVFVRLFCCLNVPEIDHRHQHHLTFPSKLLDNSKLL